jgi:flagellar hook-length control protein FliK
MNILQETLHGASDPEKSGAVSYLNQTKDNSVFLSFFTPSTQAQSTPRSETPTAQPVFANPFVPHPEIPETQKAGVSTDRPYHRNQSTQDVRKDRPQPDEITYFAVEEKAPAEEPAPLPYEHESTMSLTQSAPQPDPQAATSQIGEPSSNAEKMCSDKPTSLSVETAASSSAETAAAPGENNSAKRTSSATQTTSAEKPTNATQTTAAPDPAESAQPAADAATIISQKVKTNVPVEAMKPDEQEVVSTAKEASLSGGTTQSQTDSKNSQQTLQQQQSNPLPANTPPPSLNLAESGPAVSGPQPAAPTGLEGTSTLDGALPDTGASSPVELQSAAPQASAPPLVNASPPDRMMTLDQAAKGLDQMILKTLRSDQNSMRVELQPANLGRMVMHCRETRSGLNVEINVQDHDVRNLLQSQEQNLRSTLESQGMQMSRFSVSCKDGGHAFSDAQTNNPFRQQRDKTLFHQTNQTEPEQTTTREPGWFFRGSRNRWTV